MKRLVLIDGHAVLHRAYHALPKTLTFQGQPINAVYGFTRMIFSLINELSPTHLAAAFDLPKPTFRKKLFKDYQAKRPKMDAELAGQIEPIHQVLRAFDIPIFEKEGFEADDIIGTLSAQEELNEVVIVTGDRDIFQLIDGKTKVYSLKKGIAGGDLLDEEKAEEILGVKPEQLVDYKALAGDAADNYPGVAGIGPKTAKKLLAEHGNLEQLLAKKLVPDEKAALLSQKLAKIIRDVPLEFELEKSRLAYDKDKVRAILEKFGFKSLIKELDKEKQMRLI